MKLLIALVAAATMSLSALAGEYSIVSFPLGAGSITNDVPSNSRSDGYALQSWSVSSSSNVYGTVSLYKRYRGALILIDTLSTTNTGRTSLMAAPVKLTRGDGLVVDCSGLSGGELDWFVGTTKE